ncbi:MAG: FadR family transcriptional regulator [Acidobacteria bacterium]|nr:FadR family transcriptional regulator [Acidobacteriota bacterium]
MYQRVIRQPQMYEEVARQIEAAILNEQHRPGDQLPSERELIGRLGVSRAVIRESLKVLAEKGLIEVKPGKGAFVREPESASAASALKLYLRRQRNGSFSQNLVEVREMIEEQAASLAATRATAEDIAKLEAALAEMEAEKENAARFAQADLRFHLLLAEATRNELFPLLLHPVTDLLLDLMAQLSTAPTAPEQALWHHRQILRHIKSGAAAQARQAMHSHLSQFAKRLKKYQAAQRPININGKNSE